MNRDEFQQRLRENPILVDGAMGTVLHGRGIPIDQCFDALNFRDPALIADIHRAYIDAGADIIETNTFGANSFKLAEHVFGIRSNANQSGGGERGPSSD